MVLQLLVLQPTATGAIHPLQPQLELSIEQPICGEPCTHWANCSNSRDRTAGTFSHGTIPNAQCQPRSSRPYSFVGSNSPLRRERLRSTSEAMGIAAIDEYLLIWPVERNK
jgi:hypothetical protein